MGNTLLGETLEFKAHKTLLFAHPLHPPARFFSASTGHLCRLWMI